jgi:hypothetical protein
MIAMTAVVPIKAISVDELERAFREFEVDAAPGSSGSDLIPYLLRRARPVEELGEAEADQLVFLDPAIGSAMFQLLTVMLTQAANDHIRFGRLVELLMPDDAVPDSAVVEQARRNAEARTAFLERVPTGTSAELAELAGSRARNKAALAGGWRKAGRVFAVLVSGQLRFPLFQFDRSGQPKPELAELIRTLDVQGLSGWELALWFTGASERLEGKRPLDLLDAEAERVLEAARRVAEIPW